jgi:hypothetical protein
LGFGLLLGGGFVGRKFLTVEGVVLVDAVTYIYRPLQRNLGYRSSLHFLPCNYFDRF